MVRLTRLNGSEHWLNPLLIESVEATPDCVVTMTNGHKYIVRETPDEIEAMLIQFYRGIGLIAAAPGKGDE
ncbi:flagellar FlbD family protein [Alicyclobacillus dauci]|uniref:Flagellar FlbD family protein n=1 Tax=Alicyclobacillus dauci TaxID=1475485 RepID=A0ABY6YYL8_9BACL|nr:flagellar FlbD family protein [Alicyclobacillus dauci]WAH35398.1 flagellar FlbD family protein [Alicyclobacillus dauci]